MLDQAVEQAFEVLKTYDWGDDRNKLNPIDNAIVATQEDAAARAELEAKVAGLLTADVSYDAKDFACRKLRDIGTKASVPTLAALLTDEKLSHMVRYALERIPGSESAKAIADAIGKVKGTKKAGMISSAVKRSEVDVTSTLAGLLKDGDKVVARSAALGLGTLASAEAAKALAGAELTQDVVDASFQCAESLLAQGKKNDAKMIYMKLLKSDEKHVKLGATKGMLNCR